MFTGIVTDIGKIIAVSPMKEGKRLRVMTAYDISTMNVGCSIAHGGICLTVVNLSQDDSTDGNWYEVEAWEETLCRTNISSWDVGTHINLERSLKLEDELGGHLVSGHVDGTVEIISLDVIESSMRCRLSLPNSLKKFIAVKGSVCLDGVSLTVNSVREESFDILLIHHTLEKTVWSMRKVGDFVNIEVDSIARYISRLFELTIA
ncbi:riboflavin synthase [Candidatus Liberibacter sp.]|uniref:riboflavin synthase n=1 Tax=Candidatus Liberibacter sp. TaxID=34022 RepID=UPI0015F406AE|nr:riboflavin synthase [Candidatus Liberibacter sp.]MBA5723595.1 riboflavin synthase [Candidatus Liberibacter sp.]